MYVNVDSCIKWMRVLFSCKSVWMMVEFKLKGKSFNMETFSVKHRLI